MWPWSAHAVVSCVAASWRHATNEARWWVTAPSHRICGRDGSLGQALPVPLQSIPASTSASAWQPVAAHTHPGRPSAGTSEVTRRCREFRNTAVLDSRVPLAAVDGLGSAPCTVKHALMPAQARRPWEGRTQSPSQLAHSARTARDARCPRPRACCKQGAG